MKLLKRFGEYIHWTKKDTYEMLISLVVSVIVSATTVILILT